MNENVEYVKKVLPKPILFVQLAEECDELGQAALKISRKVYRRKRKEATANG